MIEVTIKIKGIKLSLTPDELRQLRREIDEVLGKEPTSVPLNPLFPNTPFPRITRPRPYDDWKYPIITYTDGTDGKVSLFAETSCYGES